MKSKKLWAVSYLFLKNFQCYIKKIEAKGIDLNSADYDGRTALHLAASEGQAEVVEYLIRRKVNADVKDRWGGTPSKDAKRGKHKIIVELLENYLAN